MERKKIVDTLNSEIQVQYVTDEEGYISELLLLPRANKKNMKTLKIKYTKDYFSIRTNLDE